MNKLVNTKEKIILGIIGTISMLVISTFTSPISKGIGYDSGIFLDIGRNISQGKLLYVDIFDHKGPVLFFLNAFPQLFVKGTLGVWILQVIFFVISIILLESISRILVGKKFKFITPIIYTIYVSYTFQGGNLSEEYSNLFCIIAVYIFLKYYKDKDYAIEKLGSLIIGMCFMLIALIRVNNAAIIVSIIIFMTIFLIYNKEFKKLRKAIINFIIGNLIILIPIAMYFFLNNAFYEFINGAFLFNMKYKGASIIEGVISLFSYGGEFSKIIYSAVIFSTISVILSYLKKNYFLANFILLNFIINIVAIGVAGKSYLHYVTIIIPTIILSIDIILAKINMKILKQLIFLIIIFLFINMLFRQTKECLRVRKEAISYRNQVLELKSYIDDDSSVFGYNTQARWFFIGDIPVYERFFTLQDWWNISDSIVLEEIERMFETNMPKWIITPNVEEIESINVKKIIKEKYKFIHKNNTGELYEKINNNS